MVDIATLGLEVRSDGVVVAKNRLRDLETQGKKTETATDKLTAGFAKLAATLGLMAIATKIASDFFKVNVEFQKLQSQLITVTGSTEKANAAFAALERFATTTPFELQEVVEAFTILKARGMDPSIDALTKYGNMASAYGRSLKDTITAIAQATQGEMESIKAFGVSAKQEGDKVTFTYKGVKETVGRNVDDIEAYFQRLSKANFAGGMSREMDTLGGAVSNLKDQIAKVYRTIGDAFTNQKTFSAIQGITKWLSDNTPMIAKGLAWVADIGKSLVDVFVVLGKAIAVALQPLMGFFNILKAMWEEGPIWKSWGRIKDEVKASVEAMKAGIEDIEATLVKAGSTTFRDEVDAYFKKQATTKQQSKVTGGAGWDSKPAGDKGPTDAERKLAEELAKQRYQRQEHSFKEVRDLEDSLMSQEERIRVSYQRRRDIIDRAIRDEVITIEHGNEIKKKLAEEEAANREKFLTANQQQAIGIMSNQLGQIASMMDQGNKEQFQIYKGLAVAQAGLNTALAVSNALAVPPFPVGVALASVAGAIGATQMALIASQKYQPTARAIGGDTPAGIYRVGERGPEDVIIPADGYVVPNHETGRGGNQVSVTNVFQISTGVAETARAEIARMLPVIEQRSVAAVHQAINSGGPLAAAVGRR